MKWQAEPAVRPSDPHPICSQPLQRAVGSLAVAVKARGGAPVLDRLRQSGCLKARLPRPSVAGWMDVITLNTSGGVAGGDRLDTSFEIRSGARATIAAQAAERFYRAPPGSTPARIRTRIALAEGAAAEWLPQDSILFDRCALTRRLDVEVAASARFTGVETLVFGRAAMGERVRQAWLCDVISIRREGRLLLHDAIRFDGPVDAMMQRSAIANGAGAVATVLHVAQDADDKLHDLREALAGTNVECGASVWDAMLIARILAADAAILRRAVIAALQILRDARPLPRVWLC